MNSTEQHIRNKRVSECIVHYYETFAGYEQRRAFELLLVVWFRFIICKVPKQGTISHTLSFDRGNSLEPIARLFLREILSRGGEFANTFIHDRLDPERKGYAHGVNYE